MLTFSCTAATTSAYENILGEGSEAKFAVALRKVTPRMLAAGPRRSDDLKAAESIVGASCCKTWLEDRKRGKDRARGLGFSDDVSAS